MPGFLKELQAFEICLATLFPHLSFPFSKPKYYEHVSFLVLSVAECECYRHADSCHYNDSLGHGVCDDCYHNTTGLFCEKCVEKFYRNMSKNLDDPKVCLRK